MLICAGSGSREFSKKKTGTLAAPKNSEQIIRFGLHCKGVPIVYYRECCPGIFEKDRENCRKVGAPAFGPVPGDFVKKKSCSCMPNHPLE